MRTNNFPRVRGGYRHAGLGYKIDRTTGEYPVYPLPRWRIFESHARSQKGSYGDILHYMYFLQDSYQTVNEDIKGSEIAKVMCKLYKTDPGEELREMIQGLGSEPTLTWDGMYDMIREDHAGKQLSAVGCRRINDADLMNAVLGID